LISPLLPPPPPPQQQPPLLQLLPLPKKGP
jgi:hypothetical protein